MDTNDIGMAVRKSKEYTDEAVADIWGNWNEETTYTEGQVVQKDNAPYQKKAGASTTGTWVASEWKALDYTEMSNKANKDSSSQSFAIGYDAGGLYIVV